MELQSRYRFYREGHWGLLVHSQLWSERLWEEVSRILNGGSSTRHPQTMRVHFSAAGESQELYLKVYHRSGPLGAIKDLFRVSKAFRALRQSDALLCEGFHAPLAVGAGEQRTARFVKKAFLLTLRVEGKPLPDFLRDHYSCPLDAHALKEKRERLKHLAMEIRRLHQAGFVHGDLVPYNILVQVRGDRVAFFYMDNDRTRRYPRWIPHGLWRRNLVQLNRFPLPGISARDRIRFLRSYMGDSPGGKRERRLALWVGVKTNRRLEKYRRQ